MVELKLSDLIIDSEFETVLRKHTPEEASNFERQMINHGGAYNSIKVWNDNGKYVIVDGHHRYWFLQSHPEMKYRIEVLPEIQNRHEAKMWMYFNQKGQRQMTPFELSELALKFEPELREEAKKRQGKRNDLKEDNIVQNSAPSSEKNKTRDEMARMAGVSHDTIDKTKKILAEGTEEQINAVRSGEKSIYKVYNEIRPPKKKEEEDDTSKKNNTRSEQGEKVVQGRELSKRIAEIDRLMSDPDERHEYTVEDAEEEFEIIMNEFMSKIRRVIEVRSNVVKGSKKLKSLIFKFSTELKKLKEEI